MDVHLRDLRYFVAVAENLHFTRAAETLFVSQPALSRQIRSLESQLRVVLFERHRREVRLTPAGAAFLPQAQHVLRAWRLAQDHLAAAVVEQAATLVVGMSTAPSRGLLPVMRAQLTLTAPSALLQLRQISWADPTGGLTTEGPERTDAAFVWLPVPQIERFGWLPMATERCFIAIPPGHRLSERDMIDISEILDEPFLALPQSSGDLREFWLAVESRHGQTPTIGAEIANGEEAVEALTAGLGVCLLAEGNAPVVARNGITVHPITGVKPAELVLLWRRDDERPLLNLLISAAQYASSPTGNQPLHKPQADSSYERRHIGAP